MRTTRVAVFGAGFWAPFQIAAWRELPGVEIVAIANRTVGKAEALAARFGIPRVYGDPAELLRRERPDVAGVATERDASPAYAWADPAYGACHANLLAAVRGEGAAETTAEDNLRTCGWSSPPRIQPRRPHAARWSG
jgi:hypothetical protein